MADVFSRSGPERLVSGGMWFLILMMLSGIFWLSFSVVIGRYYGPEGYGIYSTAFSLHNFAWVITFGGLFEGLIKFGSEYVAKKGWKLGGLFSASLKYLTAFGVILFLLLSALAFNISDPIMRIIVLSTAVSLLFSGTKDALAAVIGSFQKSDYLSIVQSSRSIIVFVVGVAFILLSVPAYYLPILIVWATVWQLGLCVYFLRDRLPSIIAFNPSELFGRTKASSKLKMRRFDNFKQFTRIFVFGSFISLGLLSFNVMKSLDIVVLKIFFDYREVGIYSIADAASSILFYMTSFSLPVIPAIAEAYATKNKRLLRDYLKIAMKYPALIGVPLTVVIMTMADPIVTGVYGIAFAEAVLPLQILIIGTFMLMFGYNLASILIGIGKSKISGTLMSMAAIQYIASLFILVPMFDFVGAALSLTLTGFTSMLLVPYYLKKELKVSLYHDFWKVILSAVVMAALLFIVPKTNVLIIILAISGGVVVFYGLLYMLGYVTHQDREFLKIAGGTFKDIVRPKKKR